MFLASTAVKLLGSGSTHPRVAGDWRQVDWARLTRRALILGSLVAAVLEVYGNAHHANYGFDFHGGAWVAGRDLLHGLSPYPPANSHGLLVHANAFVTPPLLAVIAIPFSVLPYGIGVGLWNLTCVVAFALALWILGVRDWRLYILALCSWPSASSLIMGQPDGVFALAAAVAWRFRDSWRGAVAAGGLIAAKLLALPLLIWLVWTRRFRLAAIAAASTAGCLAASWACIGFNGLTEYPKLLAADAHAFEIRSHSVVAAAMRLGASEPLARLIAVGFALGLGFAIVRSARGSDLGCFSAALLVGLFLSPIMWTHYLVLLFVPLAIARPSVDAVWLLPALFYLSPIEPPPFNAQVLLVASVAALVALRATSVKPRITRLVPRSTFV